MHIPGVPTAAGCTSTSTPTQIRYRSGPAKYPSAPCALINYLPPPPHARSLISLIPPPLDNDTAGTGCVSPPQLSKFGYVTNSTALCSYWPVVARLPSQHRPSVQPPGAQPQPATWALPPSRIQRCSSTAPGLPDGAPRSCTHCTAAPQRNH
ncbi:hypothetical protein BKA56DRAFT_4413 [Ilyonectria sp. MPI-CAGE-AT-0026]|nr:hypothetical protein BKA56DRAFT_4413 [Ilyonectria sp. MPI-CAGE-AT-0026]